MKWVRGDTIGYGSFGTVNLAKSESSVLMAVKSVSNFDSDSLRNEKLVLDQIGSCPEIVKCLGDDYRIENGEELYNVFLEFASNGSLADLVKKSGGNLGELEIREHTRSILKGLKHVHGKGFVHCDIKLQNLLVFGNGGVKIADFGLAKESGEGKGKKFEIRGTPLYLAPESVTESEYDSPADIWALGCAVVEMATGKPAWNAGKLNIPALMIKIGTSEQSPEIPNLLSEDGKDFLLKCFVKNPRNRWTAEMLLDHPFLAGGEKIESDGDEFDTSPRGPLDFPEWSETSSPTPSIFPGFSTFSSCSVSTPVSGRIHQLVSNSGPSWSISGSNWFTVR